MKRRFPVSLCPSCGVRLDVASFVVGTQEQEPLLCCGDLLVCACCAAVLQFDAHLRLTALTDDDWQGLSADEWEVVATLRRELLDWRNKEKPSTSA
jgi:hypothetical protein